MKLELTQSETLVLHEWLCNNSKKAELFEDIAEQIVLWNIACQLEKGLPDIFAVDYTERLAQAREVVRKTY